MRKNNEKTNNDLSLLEMAGYFSLYVLLMAMYTLVMTLGIYLVAPLIIAISIACTLSLLLFVGGPIIGCYFNENNSGSENNTVKTESKTNDIGYFDLLFKMSTSVISANNCNNNPYHHTGNHFFHSGQYTNNPCNSNNYYNSNYDC